MKKKSLQSISRTWRASPGKFAAVVGPQGTAEYLDERKLGYESILRRRRERLARQARKVIDLSSLGPDQSDES